MPANDPMGYMEPSRPPRTTPQAPFAQQPQDAAAPQQQQQQQVPLSRMALSMFSLPLMGDDRVQQAVQNPQLVQSLPATLTAQLVKNYTSPSNFAGAVKTPTMHPFLQALFNQPGLRRPSLRAPMTHYLSQLLAQGFGNA